MNVMTRRYIALFSLSFLSMAALAVDPQYTEWTAAGGNINWTTGQVSAEGYGLPPAAAGEKAGPLLACRAAVVDAQRNLLEATQGVRVTATTIIDNYMLGSDEVKSTVEGIIRNARIMQRAPQDDGSCKVVLQFSLAGDVSKALYRHLEPATQAFQLHKPLHGLPMSFFSRAYANTETLPTSPWMAELEKLNQRLNAIEARIASADVALSPSNAETPSVLPTGLVVDARGSNFIPSLSPKIRKLRGEVVYPGELAKKTEFIERGQLVSLFARDLDFAMQHPSVGTRPLLVKALRTYGDTRTEIVVATENADNLVALGEKGFFRDAGVIIILD